MTTTHRGASGASCSICASCISVILACDKSKEFDPRVRISLAREMNLAPSLGQSGTVWRSLAQFGAVSLALGQLLAQSGAAESGAVWDSLAQSGRVLASLVALDSLDCR